MIWAVDPPEKTRFDPISSDFLHLPVTQLSPPQARLHQAIRDLGAWAGVGLLSDRDHATGADNFFFWDEWDGELAAFGQTARVGGLEIFRGLDAVVVDALRERDAEAYLSAREHWGERWSARQSMINHNDYREFYEPGSTTWVTALAPNGAVLAIRGRVKVPARDPQAATLEEMDDE